MMRFLGGTSLRPGHVGLCRPRTIRGLRKAVRVVSTFGVNEAKPAYDVASRPWAPLVHPPSTINLMALNDQSMTFYDWYNMAKYRGVTVRDWRRDRGIEKIEDALDAFRVTVKVSPANEVFLPQRPLVAEKAKAAAKEQGANDQMAEAAAQQALASFDAFVDVMREHGDFEYTLDRHLHMLPELGSAMGQRVVYMGDSRGPGDEGAEVHDLKKLLVGLVSKGCTLDKNNVWVLYYPGGRPDQLMEAHGVTHGVSHGGRISLAWNTDLDNLLNGDSAKPSTRVRSRELDPAQISGGQIEEVSPPAPAPSPAPPEAADRAVSVLDLSEQTLDKLKMLWYDQPANYGGNPTTWNVGMPTTVPIFWSLTVFDPSTIEWGGWEVEGRPPVQPDVNTFRAWAENTEMWSALDLITVPYPLDTAEEQNAYERNPVEIKKATDLVPYANNVLVAAGSHKESEESKAALGVLHGYAEYCEEGKVNAKNIGLCTPLNWQSVKDKRITKDAFERFVLLAEAFEARSPRDAWGWLRSQGYINAKQYSILEKRGYINQRLRVLDDSVRPWTDYRPKGVVTDPEEDGYGLYTRPATAVTITAHYMASNFPREELTKGFLKGVTKVLELPENSPARQYLVQVAQGQGLVEVSAEAVARMLAIGFLGGVLQRARPQLLEKMRYSKMDAADRESLDKYLDRFYELAVNPTLDRDTLVVEIKKLNDEFRDVKFPSLEGKMGQTIPNKEVRGLQFYSPLQGIECPKGAPFMSEMVGHHHLAFMINERFRTRQ